MNVRVPAAAVGVVRDLECPNGAHPAQLLTHPLPGTARKGAPPALEGSIQRDVERVRSLVPQGRRDENDAAARGLVPFDRGLNLRGVARAHDGSAHGAGVDARALLDAGEVRAAVLAAVDADLAADLDLDLDGGGPAERELTVEREDLPEDELSLFGGVYDDEDDGEGTDPEDTEGDRR